MAATVTSPKATPSATSEPNELNENLLSHVPWPEEWEHPAIESRHIVLPRGVNGGFAGLIPRRSDWIQPDRYREVYRTKAACEMVFQFLEFEDTGTIAPSRQYSAEGACTDDTYAGLWQESLRREEEQRRANSERELKMLEGGGRRGGLGRPGEDGLPDDTPCRVFLYGQDINGLQITVMTEYRPYMLIRVEKSWGRHTLEAIVRTLQQRSRLPPGSVRCDSLGDYQHASGAEPDATNSGLPTTHRYMRVSFPNDASRRDIFGLLRAYQRKGWRLNVSVYDPAKRYTANQQLNVVAEEHRVSLRQQFLTDIKLKPGQWMRLEGYRRHRKVLRYTHADEELFVPAPHLDLLLTAGSSFADEGFVALARQKPGMVRGDPLGAEVVSITVGRALRNLRGGRLATTYENYLLRHIVVQPDRTDLPPILMAAKDFETNSTRGKKYYSNAQCPGDDIFMAGVALTWVGRIPEPFREQFPAVKLNQPFYRLLLTSRRSDPVPGAVVAETANEVDLLRALRDLFVGWWRIDGVTGWNIWRFDNPYLRERVRLHAGAAPDLQRMYAWRGRILSKPSPDEITTHGSENMGGTVDVSMMWPTRFRIDGWWFDFMNNKQRETHSLGDVAAQELGLAKDPVSYQDVFVSATKFASRDDVAKVARYCVQDADLSLHLMQHLGVFLQTYSESTLAVIPFDQFNCKLLTERVVSMFFYELRNQRETQKFVWNRMGNPFWTGGITGGSVLVPRKEFFDAQKEGAVVALDFQGLYPSIMMTYNYCPSTVCVDDESVAVLRRAGRAVHEIDTPDCPEARARFVANPKLHGENDPRQMGIIPELEMRMRDTRKAIKRLMNAAYAAGNVELGNIYNCQQQSLKVLMNSLFGTQGAEKGLFSFIMVAAAITVRGGRMIRDTVNFVEKTDDHRELLAAPRVIYGDTDSVYVLLKTKSVADAIAYGDRVSKALSKFFSGEVVMEFETIAARVLLNAKKKYAYWGEDPGKVLEALKAKGLAGSEVPVTEGWAAVADALKITVKGMKSIRRDSCKAARAIVADTITTLLTCAAANPVQEALTAVAKGLRRFVTNTVDLAEYVTTSKYKAPESYAPDSVVPKATIVHWTRERNVQGSGFMPGDRVEWVVGTRAARERLFAPSHLVQYNKVFKRDLNPNDDGKPNTSYRIYETTEICAENRIDRAFYVTKQLRNGVASVLFLSGGAAETLIDEAARACDMWDRQAAAFAQFVAEHQGRPVGEDGLAPTSIAAFVAARKSVSVRHYFTSANKDREAAEDPETETLRTRAWSVDDLPVGAVGEPTLTEPMADLLKVELPVARRITLAKVGAEQAKLNRNSQLTARTIDGAVVDRRFDRATNLKQARRCKAAKRKRAESHRETKQKENWNSRQPRGGGASNGNRPRHTPGPPVSPPKRARSVASFFASH